MALHGEDRVEGTEINLAIEETYLGGYKTCHDYGGGPDGSECAGAGDGSLTISHEIGVALQLCPEPEGLMEHRATHIEALRNAVHYHIVDRRLEIADAAGETTPGLAARLAPLARRRQVGPTGPYVLPAERLGSSRRSDGLGLVPSP